jgi:hypothetical protein
MTGTTFVPMVVAGKSADVGVAPLLVRRRGPLALLNWVPFPYLGPLVPPEALGGTLDAVHRWAAPRGVLRHQQSFAPSADVDEDTLVDRGYTVQNDSTYVVPMRRSREQQWAALDSRCRNGVRKAHGLGVRIEDAPDTTALGEAVEAVFAARGLRSGYRHQFPPSLERLRALSLTVHATVAIHEGRTVGGLVTFEHEGRAFVWLGGVRPDCRSTYANTLLYWDAIEWARGLGAAELDLVGLPDEGIARFKRQFGGELRSYPVARRISAAGRIMEAAGRRIRRV